MVGITKEGLTAFGTWEFIILQRKVFGTLMRDISLVLTNLALAFIAVYSSVQSINESAHNKDIQLQFQRELMTTNNRIKLLEDQIRKSSYHSDTLLPQPSVKNQTRAHQ